MNIKRLNKTLKILLCSIMLVIGLFMNPLKVNAESRAGLVQYRYLNGTINGTDIGGTVSVRLRVYTTNDGITESMGYPASGSSCSSSNATVSCTFTDISHTGTSYVGSSSQLVIRFRITLQNTTTIENRTYEAYIVGNRLTKIEQK